ncbi:MAG: hypothetical protein GXP62_18030, partial [Oligoflexia bacterium]|nr:hypothetical protein [Oligoflexia bacterium]
RLREVLPWVGLDAKPVEPAPDETVRQLGATRLVAASAAALAAGPDLSGKGRERVLARRTAAQLGATAGIDIAELSWALGQPCRSVRRLQQAPVDDLVADAVRRSLALELRVG